MMSSLSLKGLVKEDYLNIAQTLMKNGAVNEAGQFNVKMLEGIKASGKELIPFVILTRLTDKEQESFKDYYHEDLSLSEIAEANNVSRNAIHKTLKNVLEKLDFYEKSLRFYEKKQKINAILKKIDNSSIKEEILEIING